MLKDCDYVVESSYKISIVKGYWNKDKILVTRVFEPSLCGDRFNKFVGLRYQKSLKDVIEEIEYKDIRFCFEPRLGLKMRGHELKGIWRKILEALLKVGIPKDDIGIIGSFLVGFEVKKDVDFIVYGIENMLSLKENLKAFLRMLRLRPISREHILYEVKKFTQWHSQTTNSFDKLLANKWSSIQIKRGLLTTIWFGYKEGEVPRNLNLFKGEILEPDVKVEGDVIEDWRTNFVPRYFKIRDGERKFGVGSYYWAYQSCVRVGDRVRVFGHKRENDVIVIEKPNHGIKILN